MPYTPDKGDIIWLDFGPSSGKETMKHRPAFVISRKAFNQHVGLVIVAPITSTLRGIKLEVVLPDTLKIQGAVLVHQLKSLDAVARNAQLIESAPVSVIDEVTALTMALIR